MSQYSPDGVFIFCQATRGFLKKNGEPRMAGIPRGELEGLLINLTKCAALSVGEEAWKLKMKRANFPGIGDPNMTQDLR